METSKRKSLIKWFVIGAVILAPGTLTTMVILMAPWWVGIALLILAQLAAGYIVTSKVSSSLSDMSINPVKIGKMERALALASNEEMIKGYIQWVKDNSNRMNQDEAKTHFDNIKQIEESISFIHKYKDR